MGLETALSKPVQLDRREEILRRALLARRVELRKSWRHFISTECLESLGSHAPEVESFLSGHASTRDWRPPAAFTWVNCDLNFSDCLGAIALARKIEYRPSDIDPERMSLADLKRLSSNDRCKTLCARYRCPLNIGITSEFDIAEELLRQFMVPDRARLETGAEFDIDEVLLKLNLVGIRALI